MKKIFVVFLVIGIFSTISLASSSLRFLEGKAWSSQYSEKIGHLYLLGIVGTTGLGGALGYIATYPYRRKVGFLNPVVGENTYAVALGVNLNPTGPTPAAYFEYDTKHIMLPIFYKFKFTAGNYGLPNFGINLRGKAYTTLASVSVYTEEHFRLVFGSEMDTIGFVNLSFKNLKGDLFFTNEVGSLFLSSVGITVGPVALNVGAGYNGDIGFNFGISSAKANMSGGWWLRYVRTSAGGMALFYDLNLENSQFIFGYNKKPGLGAAVYVSVEH